MNVNYELLKQIEGLEDMIMAKSVNPYDVEKIPTGIKDLDEKLNGGIPRGQLTLIAGYEGSGKSHFVSQIVAEAIDNRHTAFILSGEQSAGQSQHILACQLSGSRTMERRTAKSGRIYHAIRPNIERFIQKYYEGKILYYNPTKDVKNAYRMFLNSMEIAAKAGVNVFIVDNLMTLSTMFSQDIMGSGLSDNTIQGSIAQWLEQFAAEHNVYVVLAVHKRKTSGQGLSVNINQEILGSSNVANAAGLIIHYDAAKLSENDIDMRARRAKITKNRLFGNKDFAGVDTKYDTSGHRLYTDSSNKRYNWETKYLEREIKMKKEQGEDLSGLLTF